MKRNYRWAVALLLGAAGAVSIAAQTQPCSSARIASVPARATEDWNASSPVRIGTAGTVSRNQTNTVQNESAVPENLRIEHMILLLEPDAKQKVALDAELATQQAQGSCQFHQWLTPEAFAAQFAVASEDAKQVVAWLESEGFTVAALPTERGWIEFSGTAAQIELAFDSEVHQQGGATGQRYVLSKAISVPGALAPIIHGLVLPDTAATGNFSCKTGTSEAGHAYCAALDRQNAAEGRNTVQAWAAQATPAATVITLTASPKTLTIGIPEAFTAVLAPAAGSTGSDNITGTVDFYDGATLLGSATVNSYAATLSSITLDTSKSHTITAVYSGDTNWAAVTSAPLSLASAQLADTVTLTAVPVSAGPGQSITFIVTVAPTKTPDSTYEQNPTGTVTFYNGTTSIGAATLAAATGNSSTASFSTSNLAAGSDSITAVYAGDTYYAAGTSNAVTVSVQDFSVVPTSSSNLTIVKGQSGQASFAVSGLGGYNNQIQITCTPPPQDDMTCSPSPTQVTPNATVTFTVQTYTKGGPSAVAAHRGSGTAVLARAAGGFAIAFVLLLAPVGRRARVLRRSLALVLFLSALGGAGIGCGGSSSSSGSSDSGTPLGTTTLTITATSYVNQAVVNHTVYLTVNVVPGT